jgi:hypothetical protein
MARTKDDTAEYILETYSKLLSEGEIKQSTERIAYTDDFEKLYAHVTDEMPDLTRNEVFVKLANARKRGLKKTRIVQATQEQLNKLTLAQLRILKAINRSPAGLNREEIARIADVPPNMNATLGPVGDRDDARDLEEEIGKPTLIGRGMVKPNYYQSDMGRGTVVLYTITPLGEKYLKDVGRKVERKM